MLMATVTVGHVEFDRAVGETSQPLTTNCDSRLAVDDVYVQERDRPVCVGEESDRMPARYSGRPSGPTRPSPRMNSELRLRVGCVYDGGEIARLSTSLSNHAKETFR
jgi:hypothetical protein